MNAADGNWNSLKKHFRIPESIRYRCEGYQSLGLKIKYPEIDLEKCLKNNPYAREDADWKPSEIMIYLIPDNGNGNRHELIVLEGPTYNNGQHQVLMDHVRSELVPSMDNILSDLSEECFPKESGINGP